jgi:hypothetical protein
MGLLSGIVLLPLAPLRGTIWLAEQLALQADRELNDGESIRRRLVEAEAAFESGRISATEHEALEDELLERLFARSEWSQGGLLA